MKDTSLMDVLRRALTIVAMGGLMMGAAACDDDDDDTLGPDDDDETFEANLVALNSSGVSGTVEFTVDEEDDEFMVTVTASGLDPSITHAQHIHFAAVCPDATDDANSDGVVDVMEGAPDYGLILVPLDSDLSTQSAGTFPTADASGDVSYTQTTTLSVMLADLQAADPDTSDLVTKLAAGAELDLSGRTVVLHGVDPTTTLPAGVDAGTLPVACGMIDVS